MMQTSILRTTTIFALFLMACRAVSLRPSTGKLGLQASSRSEICPVLLDQDAPRRRTSFRWFESRTGNWFSSNARIVNGDEASPNLIPYLVAIFKFDEESDTWSSHCSGTLVSSRWVISAARCNVTIADKLLLLGRNTADFNGTDSKLASVSEVSSVTPHANYSVTEEGSIYDIAAIELAKDAPEDALFMKVNVNPSLPETRSYVRIAGFGITETGVMNPVRNRDLLQVDVPTTTFEDCAEIYKSLDGVDIDRNANVCAGYLGKGQCDYCDGDDGGPMIQYNAAGEPVLMGVVSAGAGCALREFPGVYIRPAAYESWMDQETNLEYTKTRTVISQFDNSLSTGAIAGISVAALILVLLIVLIVIFIVRRRRSQRYEKPATQSADPTQTTVPSAVDAGMNEWNTRPSPVRPPQSTVGRPAMPYVGMTPRRNPQVPPRQLPSQPPMPYASGRPSSVVIPQQPQLSGINYTPAVAMVDYSQAGLRDIHGQTTEYAYRGEAEGSASPPSAGDGG